MTIEELFGTLQQSTVASWRKHLRTAKYAKHEALDEFYKEMPEKVDALIEAWMGAHGKKVGSFQNILSSSNMNTLKYIGELKRVCKEGYALMGDNDELKSLLDDIVNLINSTLYKVKELAESKSFKSLVEYVNESLVNEASKKYEVMFLSADSGAWTGFEDGELELSDLEEQMYEAGDIKRVSFNAPNDNVAIKKAQKELDKWDDPHDCIAASIYLDNADDGDMVETIYSKAWMKFIKN